MKLCLAVLFEGLGIRARRETAQVFACDVNIKFES
jgi:hypothetical protein